MPESSHANSDHDLLIQIAANLENFSKSFLMHLSDDAAMHAKLEANVIGAEKKIDVVHRRVDGLQVTGILAIISFIITIILAVFVKGPTFPKELSIRMSDEQIKIFSEQVGRADTFHSP